MGPGLSLGVGASVRGGVQSRYGGTQAPTTAGQAAFGPGLDTAASTAALTPSQPGGLAFWLGLAGVALVAWTYYSLPG